MITAILIYIALQVVAGIVYGIATSNS